ncbi:MAG TPA: nicotinate-nucleotide adenylyltransferase [Chthonomonadaceae bacterium]|nr:nicotinate-nucleotide adenylyltransferase [Chthonomonadaceae bacterium]
MRLGIMGGTFDPIHFGHLFIAEEARVQFELDRVLFIPNGCPPHKPGREVAPAADRFAMAEIATCGNTGFACSAIEMRSAGPFYTVDTLDLLRDEHPGAELFTIVGVDAIAEITTWRRPEDVLAKTTFITATRPGFDFETLNERLPRSYLAKILRLDSTALQISSTDIRERVRRGRPIRYLTPDGVVEYVARSNLYAAPRDEPIRESSTTL